jgi:hypothetical protein
LSTSGPRLPWTTPPGHRPFLQVEKDEPARLYGRIGYRMIGEMATASRALVGRHPDLGELGAVAPFAPPVHSLRWTLVHLVEETARHAGHADILREHLDGVTGR